MLKVALLLQLQFSSLSPFPIGPVTCEAVKAHCYVVIDSAPCLLTLWDPTDVTTHYYTLLLLYFSIANAVLSKEGIKCCLKGRGGEGREGEGKGREGRGVGPYRCDYIFHPIRA